MNFIKKIFDQKIDKEVHKQFIRFGKGEYKGRFLLNLRKSKKIKVKTSFEFANDLVVLCSDFGNCKVSGIILSKEDISNVMSQKNIKGNSETKKGGIYYQNNIESQELEKEQLIELEKVSYFTLLDIEGEEFKLKIKKKLPKPGKAEGKIDDKFCQLEAEEKHYSKIKEDFFWDTPNTKKIDIKHTIIVKEIIIPKEEKDYAKIREMSKRKGQIIRKIKIDDQETSKNIDFEV
ncbi:MAG: hypothetical protein ABIH59_00310 [archaeon]